MLLVFYNYYIFLKGIRIRSATEYLYRLTQTVTKFKLEIQSNAGYYYYCHISHIKADS